MIDLSLFTRPAFVGAQVTAFAISSRCSRCSSTSRCTCRTSSASRRCRPACGSCRSACVAFFVAPVAGRLSARVPIRALLGTGLALYAVAMWLMSRVTVDSHLARVAAGLPRRRRRDRPGQRAARDDGGLDRSAGARRDGLRDQQHVPSGRDRHRASPRSARSSRAKVDPRAFAPHRVARRRGPRSCTGCTTS